MTRELISIYFGRLMPKKGQWYLVEALKKMVPKKNSETRGFSGWEHFARIGIS